MRIRANNNFSHFFLAFIIVTMSFSCQSKRHELQLLNRDHTLNEPLDNHKHVIYQTMVRHFGNTNTTNKRYGSIEENGVGKFNDFTDDALQKLRALGITHIWYTGVIEHATMTDYSAYGIAVDDPDVVKGRAGSPYAIKDYYDVCPDLAVDVPNRMAEFEELIRRTHQHGMKVIIDFVPNHVARSYSSDNKPLGVRDIGIDDDKSTAFSPVNDFYYLPGERLVVPKGYDAGGPAFTSPLKDGKFDEYPAKATGNNVFSATPSLDDWFETVKLNYGVDFLQGEKKHFDPIPPLWFKMRDILLYWAEKGVDGFRCDMVEMVPVEFWRWVISEVRKEYPKTVFIGEAYNKQEYANFYDVGRFDYLYDKVGLYDTLKMLIRNEDSGGIRAIQQVWQQEVKGYSSRMLRFMENHDEQRIASADFAGCPWKGIPGMVVSATLATGPVMLYGGQEVGEPGLGDEGFGGEDGRTSIFDYWGVPQHQKWMNQGKFDGGGLTPDEQKLREFYKKLFAIVNTEKSIQEGGFYDLTLANPAADGRSNRIYAYLRYTNNERLLIVANFEHKEQRLSLAIPQDVVRAFKLEGSTLELYELLRNEALDIDFSEHTMELTLPANGAKIFKF